MYLVDDVLYKKVIRPESNLRRSDKIRSSTDYYDFKDQATSQNNPSLATSETSLPLPPSYTQMNTSNTEVPAIPSSNTHFKQLREGFTKKMRKSVVICQTGEGRGGSPRTRLYF